MSLLVFDAVYMGISIIIISPNDLGIIVDRPHYESISSFAVSVFLKSIAFNTPTTIVVVFL